MMSGTPEPFLDWYGVYAGRVGYGQDGRARIDGAPQGVRLSVQQAEKSEPVLVQDRPWETNFWCATVLCEEGRYRMWYNAGSVAGHRDSEGRSMCYAESEDGFHWMKPALGLYPFQGSKANNIVLPYRGDVGSVLRDPDAPDGERYKMIYDARVAGRLVVRGAVSPDGIRWTMIEEPILDMPCDTMNTACYDEDRGHYVGHFRVSDGGRRCIGMSETEDFRHWPLPRIVLQPDPQDPPTDDLYTNAYSPYPGAKYYLMFPSVYHRTRDTLDIQLAVSRDGCRWVRPERRPIIPVGPEGSGEEGRVYAGPGLIPLGEERWGLIYTGHYTRHNEPWGIGQCRWAMWLKDRLVALEAPVEGQVQLLPRECRGDRLVLNYQTEPHGWVRAELIREREHVPLEGYSIDECDPLQGDGLAKTVTWQGNADLSALKGVKVSVRIRMAWAKVFSVCI